MRFLIYGINFAPELTGIGKYSGEMAFDLARQGHSVRVISAPPYYPEWQVKTGYSPWRYTKENLEGIEVLRCPLYVPGRTSGLKRLIHLASFMASSLPVALAQSAWKPDVVFAVAPAIFSAPVALLTGRLAGSKTWLHIQDFELEAAFNLGILKGGTNLFRQAARVEASLLKSFDRVSTISKRMVERLIQKGVDPRKVQLFPNWADIESIFPLSGRSPLRAELGIGEDRLIILYSGNMGRKQGIEILVDVAGQLNGNPAIQFVLCGDGVAKEALVQKAVGLTNITFLSLQSTDRLNELLNMADIHVLPQRLDAADLVMPSKLTGMFASGRPVIATAAQGTELHEVVSQVGLVVPPENVDAFTAAIQSLIDNPDQRRNLGHLGRQFVEKNWSRASVLQDFIDTVQSL